MRLKHNVTKTYLYNRTVIIPSGTIVHKAINLPGDNFWVGKWNGIEKDPELLSWHENYGFLVGSEDVE